MYLKALEGVGVVVDIVCEIPEASDGYNYIKTHGFNKDDLQSYNIRILNDGSVLSELKPLAERMSIQHEKEIQQQGIDLSEREIQEIIQGQQISDLEIQLLELRLGGM